MRGGGPSGQCEFAYVACTDRSVKDDFGANLVPALILPHHGLG
jgi:hypothetical protein